jgi:hypothetical protein
MPEILISIAHQQLAHSNLTAGCLQVVGSETFAQISKSLFYARSLLHVSSDDT